jgi:glycosyltransferase involved in cell wall biosynthesis
MRESRAVIQPSLFEGWSTVIEDAKALGVPVIASDLPVHLEQLGKEGAFFSRTDATELADKIRLFLHEDHGRVAAGKLYEESVRAFGEQFVAIVDRIIGSGKTRLQPD